MLDATDTQTRPPTHTHTTPAGGDDDTIASMQRLQQHDRDADQPGLRAVVAMAQQSVEHCDLASGILIRGGEADVADASGSQAADLDRLQRELGEGPGLQACELAAIVSSDQLGTDERWPAFSPHARDRGIAAMVAIPLTPVRDYPRWSGWLTLYSHSPGPFPPASIALARTLGLYYSSTVNSHLHAQSLQAALASRDLIGQAKGIIMARKGIDDEQAFAVLQQASQHANRRLRDVAESVVRSCGRQSGDVQAARS